MELSQVVAGCEVCRSSPMHGVDLVPPPITLAERRGLAPLTAAPAATTPAAAVPLAVSALGRALPTSLAIPSIGVSAPVTRVGRDENGAIAAPPLSAPRTAGWDEAGPAPGEPGAAVLVGHLGTLTDPAVFARLRELDLGAIVGVVRADETVAVFRVTATERVPKGKFSGEGFSTGRVHAAGPRAERPELRLITCAGRYVASRRGYADNLIVYASFAAAYRWRDLVQGLA
ncbi:sortase domain-containing protein [Spirillospora sp. CA-253888]